VTSRNPDKRDNRISSLVKAFLSPVLTAHGFGGGLMVWNRRIGDLAHVLEFQRSRWNAKEFTVDLGVCVRQAWEIYRGMSLPDNVREYDCYPRLRIGNILGDGRMDIWWTLREVADFESVGVEVRKVILENCLPFLDSMNSFASVVAFADRPVKYRHPEELLRYAVLKHLSGDRDAARLILNNMLSDAKLRAWHDTVNGVSDRLSHLK
jgi:hypothetical protein